MGILDSFLALFGLGGPRGPIETTPTALEELREVVDREVRMGFTEPEEIPALAADFLDGEAEPEFLLEHARQMTTDALEALAAEQATWPVPTDCDRVDRAFEKLEGAGIVARQNFTCCQTCGHGEIFEEIQEYAAGGGTARGYTFYHQQDTESAVEGGGLYLAYGDVAGDPAATLEVAREVVRALEAEGLVATWDGTPTQRIAVELDWKRRR